MDHVMAFKFPSLIELIQNLNESTHIIVSASEFYVRNNEFPTGADRGCFMRI